ncbi:MAG: zinc-binding dehydrogenase [Anaerolineae bacterium]
MVDHLMSATAGMGVEVALDAVGKGLTREQCVAATRRGGPVLLSGLHEEVSEMPVADIIGGEIMAQGSRCYTPDNVREAIHFLTEGAIDTEGWIVDSPLSEGGDWFQRLADDPGKAAKVLLRP